MAVQPGALGFSTSVRLAVADLGDGSITASALAQRLQAAHPQYADGLLARTTLDPDTGTRLPADAWLQALLDAYDVEALARSGREIIDGELVVLGLAALDAPLRAALDASGALAALLRGTAVRPAALADEARPAGARDLDVVLAQDVVGTRPLTVDDDLLGIEDDVRTLARLIVLRDATPPLAAGLFGDWGTGKSFFLERLRSRIDELQAQARATAGGLALCEHVVQVRFNAWHYMDADLWASLTSRIFETLDDDKDHHRRLHERFLAHLATATGQLEAASAAADAAEERAKREVTRLGKGQERRRQLRRALRIARRAADAPERAGRAALGIAGDDAELQPLRATLQDPALRIDRGVLLRRVALSVLAAVLVAVVAWALPLAAGWAVVASVAAAAGAAGGAASAVGRALVRARGARDRLRDQLDALEEALDDEEARAQAAREAALTAREEATRALAAVDEVRRSGLLRPLIHEGASTYRSRLGFLSQVRGDLEDMAALFDPESGDRRSGDPERIVLYIDDLDRCPPERVVDVLQAVHLLLAFPLFVVVVAVDSRWLVTSLEVHFERLLGRGEGGPANAGAALATDYLEKIFQLPIGLPPLDDRAYRALLGGVVGRRAVDEDGESARLNAPGAAAPAAAASDVPGVLARMPLPGRPLAVRFTPDGRTCVAVTTAGVFRWDRGRRTPRPLLERGLGLAAISLDGEHVAALAEDHRLLVVDVVSGAPPASTSLRYEDVRQVAPLAPGRVVVLQGDVVGVVDAREEADEHSEHQVVDGARELALAPDGRLLLVFADDGCRPFTLPLGEDRMHQFARPPPPWVAAGASRTGELLAAAPDELRLVSLEGEGEDAAILSGRSAGTPAAVTGVLGRSADGWWVATAGGVGLWPVVGGQLADMAGELVAGMTAVAADPEAGRVVAWGPDGFVVADGSGVLHRAGDERVDLAAVGARGGLAAVLDGSTLALWSIGDHADEPSEPLALTDPELRFLEELGDLVPTARAAKRLVNVYRVLRGSAAGRGLASSDGEDHRLVLVLLALVVSWPAHASRLCDAIDAAADVPPRTALQQLADADAGHVLAVVQTLVEQHDIAFDRARWDTWAPHVTRFLVPPRRRARRRPSAHRAVP